jgi:hypothetical protein
MTEQEQIEKLRGDFEAWASATPREFSLARHSNDHRSSWPNQYRAYHAQCAWEAWCEAKRNMPVIELPQGHLMDDPDGMGSGRYIMIETVERALNRAGAKYTIKGE